MQAASVRGRIVNVGRLGGIKDEFDFDLHAMKRIDYIGVTFRIRQRRETVEHPFGTLKMRMGATHLLMKRLPKVATEIALHVLAYNLAGPWTSWALGR
jgi:hypothetical protein